MTKERPKRGRPPASTPDQVLDKLLRAATDILVEQTADADFSMAQIALRAGVSKRTVYTVVPGKEMLIAHLISRNTTSALTILDTPVPDAAAARAVLARFLTQWATLALAPLAVGIYAMAVREHSRYPDIGRMYYHSGAEAGQRELGLWLQRMHGAGRLHCADPDLTADLLLSMAAAEQRLLALGIQRATGPAAIAHRVAGAVTLVCPAS